MMAKRMRGLGDLAVAYVIGLTVLAQMAVADRVRTIKDGTLTVCLPRNGGVISGRRLTGGSGFDYRVSEILSDRLGLDLNVVWIENDLDEESDPIRETYAMLSYGLCDAVPGHMRYIGAVGKASFDRAAMPRWLGMPQDIDRDTGFRTDRLAGFVDVTPITVTDGYMRSEIGLVYRKGSAMPDGLSTLGDRKLAAQQGTLSGAIATVQASRRNVVTMTPGARFLWEFEAGDHDLAIVDVAAFDGHAASNPFTPLRLADWRHPIGMDIGIAVLASQSRLRSALSQQITQLLESGQFAEIAEKEGMTFAPPKFTGLAPKLTLAQLRAIR